MDQSDLDSFFSVGSMQVKGVLKTRRRGVNKSEGTAEGRGREQQCEEKQDGGGCSEDHGVARWSVGCGRVGSAWRNELVQIP